MPSGNKADWIDMKYKEITVVTTTEASDAVSEMMYSIGAKGVNIEDPNDFRMMNQDPSSWDYVEDELLDKLGDDVKVKGYFSELEFKDEMMEELNFKIGELAGFGLDAGKKIVSLLEVDEEDWANSWKKFYKPVKVGEHLVIKPSWEEYVPEDGDIIIELDPGMAFGTGTHETTTMCMKLIESYVKPGMDVFDVGCGSGVLGISSAKIGAKKVICVDLDPVACKVALENAVINNVQDKVEVRNGNLLDVVKEKADVVIANIIADIIIAFSHNVEKFMKDGAVFISSGIIKDRKEDVLNKFKEKNFKVLKILEEGEWCAIAVTR